MRQPKEITELFFDHIETLETLASAARVSKEWHKFAGTNRQWNKFLDEENRVSATESAKNKLFKIKKFSVGNHISLKLAERRLTLTAALQDATKKQKQNLTDVALVKLYENGDISLTLLKKLAPKERDKITLKNILHLIDIKYITVDYILTCDVNSDIPFLNNPNLNPLRDAKVLDRFKEKDLTNTQHHHFADKRLHKHLIEGIINVDYVKTLTTAARHALAEASEQQDQQINFPYGI